MSDTAKFRERRQQIYDYFLDLDLERLPLKSSNLDLYGYLSRFDYPGRTKVSKQEALAICKSFQAAIQAGWVDDVMEVNGKIGLHWIPAGDDSRDAMTPKEISDRFRQKS